MTSIRSIELGFTNNYLIEAQASIAVDAYLPGKGRDARSWTEALGCPPAAIKLLVITHAHGDHTVGARAIHEAHGIPLAMHQVDAAYLEEGRAPPAGKAHTSWGSVLRGLMQIAPMPFKHIQAVPVAHKIGDQGLSLAELGVPGWILHTPGHTSGSLSLLLDSGEALVGDLIMNRRPLCATPQLSLFSDDLGQVKSSLELLLRRGAHTFYPSHGTPVSAEVVSRLLA